MPTSDRFLPAMAITLLMLDRDSLALHDPDIEYPAHDCGSADAWAVEEIITTLPAEDYTLLHLALRENFSTQQLAEIVGAPLELVHHDLVRIEDGGRRRSTRRRDAPADPLRTFAALPRITPETALHAA